MYKIVAADLDSNEREEIPGKNLVFSEVDNGPGAISFVLPIRHPKCKKSVLATGDTELHVYRGTERVWGGYLWTAQKSGETIRFGGEGYFSRLQKKRHVSENLTYTQQDQYNIAWNLIDYTQSRPEGYLGITRSDTVPSGVLRDRSYYGYERKKIGELLINLSNLENGFDFQIDPYKQWRVWSRRGVRVGHVFETGKNVRTHTYMEDGISQFISDLTGLGEGDKEAKLIYNAFDSGVRAQYKLLEDSTSYSGVNQMSTLQEHTEEDLRLRKAPREEISVITITDDPPYGAYGIGDTMRVKISDGYIQINRDLRIKALVTNVPNEGPEVVSVYFDEAFE